MMKRSLFAAIFALFAMGSTAKAALTLDKINDDSVSASLVLGYKTVSSKDEKVSASLLTIFRGGAAGMSSLVITIIDQSDTTGSDIGNTTSFDLRYIAAAPSKATLVKTGSNAYELRFEVKEITTDENGEWIYPVRQVRIAITLDGRSGAIQRVELK